MLRDSLKMFLTIAEGRPAPVTLLVHGSVVTGTIVPLKEFWETIVAMSGKDVDEDATPIVIDVPSSDPEKYLDSIILKDAVVYGGVWGMSHAFLEVDVSSIDGFSLGIGTVQGATLSAG